MCISIFWSRKDIKNSPLTNCLSRRHFLKIGTIHCQEETTHKVSVDTSTAIQNTPSSLPSAPLPPSEGTHTESTPFLSLEVRHSLPPLLPLACLVSHLEELGLPANVAICPPDTTSTRQDPHYNTQAMPLLVQEPTVKAPHQRGADTTPGLLVCPCVHALVV